jgi:hypothetical protein
MHEVERLETHPRKLGSHGVHLALYLGQHDETAVDETDGLEQSRSLLHTTSRRGIRVNARYDDAAAWHRAGNRNSMESGVKGADRDDACAQGAKIVPESVLRMQEEMTLCIWGVRWSRWWQWMCV